MKDIGQKKKKKKYKKMTRKGQFVKNFSSVNRDGKSF